MSLFLGRISFRSRIMKLRFTVNQVLQEQERLANLCYRQDESGDWPSKNVRWSFDEEEQQLFELYAEQASYNWHLQDLEIDDTRAIIALKPPDDNLLFQLNCLTSDRFILFGEIKQAPGHICAFNMRLQTMIGMLHASDFILMSPINC
jgi:hypothetical protein